MSEPSAEADAALTFEQAIENVRTAYMLWGSEFLVSDDEYQEQARELEATIAALSRPATPPLMASGHTLDADGYCFSCSCAIARNP